MIKLQRSVLSLIITLLVITNISACSGLRKLDNFVSNKRTVNYQNNASIKSLEFPPDLTTPEFDREFELPSAGTVSTVSMRTGKVVPNGNFASNAFNPSTNISNRVQSSNARTGNLSNIRTQANEAVIQINDSYPRALVLADIMLQRMNFSVLNKDSTSGVYTVKYNGADIKEDKDKDKEKGFLGNTFGYLKSLTEADSNNKILASGKTYQVHIKNQQGLPLLRFRNKSGQRLPSAHSTKIITLLNGEFNRSANNTVAAAPRVNSQAVVSRPSVPISTAAPVATSGNQQGRKLRDGNLSGLKSQNGETVLQIYDNYQRSLILMDIMLERMGFSILSRNAAAGIYQVQYNGNEVKSESAAGKVSGWFNKAKKVVGLSGKSEGILSKGKTYQVHIKNQHGFPLVTFKSETGQSLPSTSHNKILTMLNNEFNR